MELRAGSITDGFFGLNLAFAPLEESGRLVINPPLSGVKSVVVYNWSYKDNFCRIFCVVFKDILFPLPLVLYSFSDIKAPVPFDGSVD